MDGWRREVLRIDPSLVCPSSRLGKKLAAESFRGIDPEEWLEGGDEDG